MFDSSPTNPNISPIAFGKTWGALVEVLLRLDEEQGRKPHPFAQVANRFRELTGLSLWQASASALGKPFATFDVAVDFIREWTWLDIDYVGGRLHVTLPDSVRQAAAYTELSQRGFETVLRICREVHRAHEVLAWCPPSGAWQGDPLSDQDIVDALSLALYASARQGEAEAFTIVPSRRNTFLMRTLDEAIAEVHPRLSDPAVLLRTYCDALAARGLTFERRLPDGRLRFSPTLEARVALGFIDGLLSETSGEAMAAHLEWVRDLRFWLLWMRDVSHPHGEGTYRSAMRAELAHRARLLRAGRAREALRDSAVPPKLVLLQARAG